MSDSEDELFAVKHNGMVYKALEEQVVLLYVPLCFTHAENTIKECQIYTGTTCTCNIMSLKDIAKILHIDKPPL